VRPPPISVAEARAFVRQWREWFRLAPASVCLTLMQVESSFRPDAMNVTTGARGLLQLLPTTAADMAAKIRRRLMSAPPAGAVANIGDTMRLWDLADPDCILNPALGSLLGVAYLDHLAERFGPRLEPLAAAYHNGPGFLRAFLSEGKKVPADLPPKGADYVGRAVAIWPRFRDDDDDEDQKPTPARGIPVAASKPRGGLT
jgi:soluble lytic murein transglycosylase-like protein